MMKYFILLLAIILFSVSLHSQDNIIFDTDIGSDCDDAGALAILNKLADKGEVNILGVVFSSNKNKYGIGVCDAINTYYGRGDLLLGQYKGIEVGDSLDHYCKEIATAKNIYGHDVVDSAMELVAAYKKILEKQPVTSVTIVTVGHPHGLLLLLKDKVGAALIKQKVKRWIAMTHTGNSPVKDWNFGMNGAAVHIKGLLKEWPARVYFSGSGDDIITGNKKLPSTPVNNPVRKAYRLWNNALTKGRSSWDQLAVLFAVRPYYFKIDSSGSLEQNNKFETYWNSKVDNPKHYRIIPAKSKVELETIIENLMSEQPLKKR